jgi:multidrug resistance efflux pump
MRSDLPSNVPSTNGVVGGISILRLSVFGGGACLLGLAVSIWLGEPVVETVPATVQARMISVTAAAPARLAELHVRQGQSVEPNTPLFRLTDERLTARLAAKRRELHELSAECKRVEAAADVELAWRRRQLQQEALEIELKKAGYLHARVHHQVEQIAWEEQLAAAEWWVGDLGGPDAIQPLSFVQDVPPPGRLQALLRADAAAAALEANAAQLRLCEEQLAELAELEAQLSTKVRVSAGVDVAQARLERAQAELELLEQQEQALLVHSPGYGTVGALAWQVGDRLAAGQTVVELIDDDQRYLRAYVPTRHIQRFVCGVRVAVHFPSRQRLEGWVAEVPPQASVAAIDRDALTEVRIVACGKLWPKLPIGSRVEVEVP